MKCLVAIIYTSYETNIVDDSGMKQVDAVVAGPSGDSLFLRFHVAP